MPNRTDIKIFIASSGELADERKESVLLIAELNKRYPHLHMEPMLFELDTPSGNVEFKGRIQDAINPKLQESHIAVILFYTKAGEFTLEEMDLALKLDKKVFLYFKEGFTPESLDDLNKYGKVLELKAKLNKESTIRYQKYKALIDYNGMLYKDLDKYLDDTYPSTEITAKSETVSTSQQHIPLAPRPYLAHPYAIVKNFTGRQEEMRQLTEWYKYDKEPMCIVEAMGGMGKSSLCWRWLKDEVIATCTEFEGIFWWSFEKQGFEDFIHHLYEYCIPEGLRDKGERIDETSAVIAALTNQRFLLVLDSFERVLNGYAQMTAEYNQERNFSRTVPQNKAYDIHQRTPITYNAENFLNALCICTSKILMTTRLYPATIEGLAGIRDMKLTGLSKTDTITYFKTEGITGTDNDIVSAGEIYYFHPLMLKLLSSAIKRSFSRNINKALQTTSIKDLIDAKEPQKILVTSYNLLNLEEQRVAATISVFRTNFTFNAAVALFPNMETEKLEDIMIELRNLGFILHNDQQNQFDLHPILRAYLYSNLTGKDAVHQLAVVYFTDQPVKEKIVTLGDLDPVIQRYYHLIGAGKYYEAYGLYVTRLHTPLFDQLGQYKLCINLCKQLFISPSDRLPQFLNKHDQSFLLNHLGITYTHLGELSNANKRFLAGLIINYEIKNIESLCSGLKKIADLIHIPSGKLSQAKIELTKSATLLATIGSPKTVDNYRAIGRLLTAQTLYTSINDEPAAESYLKKTLQSVDGSENWGLAASIALDHTKWVLAQVSEKKYEKELLGQGLDWSLKVMDYADKERLAKFPNLLHFLYSYESISKALMTIIASGKVVPGDIKHVLFYDEHFQQVKEAVIPVQDNYYSLAEKCIKEGLAISRTMNRVHIECTFLLLFAQMQRLKMIDRKNDGIHFSEVERAVNEAYTLAKRMNYRMRLADLHLLCIEILIDLKRPNESGQQILGYITEQHFQKARELAIDTSDIKDLFLPPDGTADEFYAGIDEYEMLKRGMTHEERITNGYYAAWLKADKLEARLNA